MSHAVNVPLKDVVSLSSTTHKPSGDTHYYVGLEHIEKNTGRILQEATEEPITTVKNKFVSGEILYGKLRPNLNKVAMAHRDGVCSTDILVLRPSARLHARYLYHFMLSSKFVNDMTANVSGANLPRVSPRFLLNYSIPLPSVDEQARIADTLDTVDALRHKDKELLRKYDDLVQSIFDEMFGDPARNERGWETTTIREMVREVKYGTSSPASDQGGYPYLRMNNITYSGELDLRDLKRIDVSELDYRKYGVQQGDLLFNRTNSKELVGKTTVVDVTTPMVAAGYLIRVRCNESANPYFISAYLNSKVGKTILRNMCKSIVGMANINAQELQDIPIIAPPKALQDVFVERLLAVKRLKALAVKNVEYAEALFGSQLHRFF